MENKREIPSTMKALVAYSKKSYVLETNFPTPKCGANDLLIQTEACGICAGDLKCMHGAAMFWGDETQPSWVKPPFIPGHEFFGHIVEIGKNVTGFRIGDRIAVEQIVPCEECRFCKNGNYWMCQPHNIFGFQNTNNGGMAEYVRIPKNARIYKIPETMPLEQALLIEPYGCSKHAVDRGRITEKDIVVISGAGTLGLGMVTYAKTLNPKKLIVLDMKDERLQKAKEFGADLAWNPGKMDVIKAIEDITEGYGCDVYLEATGHPSSVHQGLRMIRKLGRMIEFSVFSEPVTVDWSIIGDRKELDILGAHLSPNTYPYVITHIENGSLKTSGIVSSMFSILEWEKGFEYASGKYGDFKVALTFESKKNPVSSTTL